LFLLGRTGSGKILKNFGLSQLKILFALFAIMLTLAVSSAFAQTTDSFTKVDQNFDHSQTAFPLKGAHQDVTCEICHVGGVFKGVPTNCASCHNDDMAKGKPATHPRTNSECSQCHNQITWTKIHVDHTPIIDGCFACHNKKVATGKTENHIKTNTKCENCHVTSTWQISHFDHTLTNEPCETCHDRLHASGKPFNHIRSTNACATCHKSVSWKVGVFDHTGVVDGCFKCHDGISATGKSSAHVIANNTCESCHNTIAWAPAKFDHDATSEKTCINCHDGIRIIGKSGAHFKTSNECAACHTVNTWKPATFVHSEASNLSNCFGCHNGSRPPASGKNPGHIADNTNDCESCHIDTKNYTTWAGAKFVHSAGLTGCSNCHNGTGATGKNQTHLNTTNVCEDCHKTGGTNPTPANWATNNFNHSQTNVATCVTCHNGTLKTTLSGNTISGKLQGGTGKHMPTTNACEVCHTPGSTLAAWLGQKLDHSEIAVTTCFSCHNGTTVTSKKTVTTKGINHVPTTAGCEDCHASFTSWKAPFNHANIGTARCDSCHNGTNATGKTQTHLTVNAGPDCNACHVVTTSWTQVTFDHSIVSTTCLSCHNGTKAISSGLLTAKPTKHIPISTGCENCHSTTTWKAKFDHTTTSAACISCHDGVNATGQLSLSGRHIPASTTCNNCHVTTSWYRPAEKMDHTDATAAGKSCATCHNGTDATNKGQKHILSSSNCVSCHKTNFANWIVAKGNMDHTDPTVAGATCFSCHDGAHADVNPISGKTLTHLKTSNVCADCHTTNAWKPALKFDHTQATGTCVSCHDGVKAQGKNVATHVKSSTNCAVCHTTNPGGWMKPQARFDHTDVTVAATPCLTCHNGSVPNALSKANAVPPHPATSDSCENCHSSTMAAFTPAHFDHSDPTVVGKPCATCHDTGKPNAVPRPANHPPLGGQDCAACHTTATWVTSGKPDHSTFVSNCITCHTGTPNAIGKVNAPNHFATSNNCDVCHNTNLFKPALFDHAEAQNATNCVTCHDGSPTHLPAFGKSAFPSHLKTSDTCSNCHAGFTSWVTTVFDHADPMVAAATCISCHDGAHPPAIAKSVAHFKTSNDCALCHNTTKFTPRSAFDHTDSVVAAATCLSCHDGAHPPALSKANTPPPGHLPTSNLCGDCHTTVSFKGAKFDHSTVAPGTCFTCHNGVRATGKILNHFATTNTCDDCHNTVLWKTIVRFPHTSTTGSCNSCHNGTRPPAVGKNQTHIKTTTLCEACHDAGTPGVWKPVLEARVDHTQVIGTCFSCHNGTVASGKSGTHFTTSNNCDACHAIGGAPWVPVKVFDHTATTGTCVSCHSGAKPPAVGKSANHMTTTNNCAACHVTTVWAPVGPKQFAHSEATGTCANCHNGTHPPAVAKSPTHFITNKACDVCHTTTNWTTLLNYTHISPAYELHFFGTNASTCLTCHKQNNEKISFLQPGLVPDCAACHADKYKPDPHVKFGNTRYTVTELKDCTGACHIYADQTLTTIKTNRTTNTKHRASRTNWN
jgi:hypothetical protein